MMKLKKNMKILHKKIKKSLIFSFKILITVQNLMITCK